MGRVDGKGVSFAVVVADAGGETSGADSGNSEGVRRGFRTCDL